MNRNAFAKAEETSDAALAFGAIVKIKINKFLDILSKSEDPLVLFSQEKFYFFKETYKYITTYKGLIFYVETEQPLSLPKKVELITADKIMVPHLQ